MAISANPDGRELSRSQAGTTLDPMSETSLSGFFEGVKSPVNDFIVATEVWLLQ